MTSQHSPLEKNPIYRKSPWLPRGAVRRCVLLGLILTGAYGVTQHWIYLVLLIFSIIILSPKVLLATAYYYGKSALFLAQLFSK
jgi:hypothetical protein